MKKHKQNEFKSEHSSASTKIDLSKQSNNDIPNLEEIADILSHEELVEYKKKLNDAYNSVPEPSLSNRSYNLKPAQSSPYDQIKKEI